MRRRRANAALPAAAAIGVRASILAFAAGPAVAAGAAPAGAQPYGRGEDLLYRPGPSFHEAWGLAAWVLYLLGVFAGGWAILRLRKHFEAPKPGGLTIPLAGALAALALLASPWLIEALVEGLSVGYRPPLRPAH